MCASMICAIRFCPASICWPIVGYSVISRRAWASACSLPFSKYPIEFAHADFTEYEHQKHYVVGIHAVGAAALAAAVADPGAFRFTQAYLSSIGFQLALYGTDLFSFPEFARHDIGFHYIKLQWNKALEKDISPSELQLLDKGVSQIGSEKIILCHCGTPAALKFGHSLGSHNFQGRHIDEMLNPEIRRQN
jgi:hypothetical protein